MYRVCSDFFLSKSGQWTVAAAKAKNGGRKGNKDRPRWPFIVTTISILIGILWKDQNLNEPAHTSVHVDCGIIMVPSSLPNNAGWGMFTLKPIAKGDMGDPVALGEVVIQLTDLLAEYATDFHVMLAGTLLVGSEKWRGGTFEAMSTHSLMPGFSALVNGHPLLSNVASTQTAVSHNGIIWNESPGAARGQYTLSNKLESHKTP